MQINTRGPSGRGTGPLPRASSAPAGAPYVGILECPCTDRVKKEIADLWLTTRDAECPKLRLINDHRPSLLTACVGHHSLHLAPSIPLAH